MKIISIIIATYNASTTLERCLISIVEQMSDKCELIVIDGDSKDTTLDIINKYSNKISYVISESDQGIYDAWNKGIKASKGEWIMFIGADDVLLPNAIDKYLNAIRETKDIDTYDYICAQNEFVDLSGKLLKLLGRKPTWGGMRRTMVAAHVASLHNKHNLFETVGEYNLNFKICADYELLLRKKNKLKSLFIPTHIARMKVGGMSFSTKAIIEVYNIRCLHHSIPTPINALLFLRDWLLYNFFIFRKSLMGMTLFEDLKRK